MADASNQANDIDTVLAGTGGGRGWRRWWWIGALLVVAVAGYLWLGRGNGSNQVQRYKTEPLTRGDLAAVVTATGKLEPTNQVDVGSELSGTVEEVLVDTNDEVKAGQALAVLDTIKLEQATERSRAALSSARGRLAQAQATANETAANLARFEEVSRLSGGKVPSKSELDAQRASALRAAADLQSAQAAITEAESTLRANESDLKKGIVRSPIDGIVLERVIEPGQTVAASFQAPVLFTLAQDLKRMELTVDVAEADVGLVAAGQTATFTVDAWPGKRYEANVLKVRFGSKVVENVVSYETELAVANDDLSLRPGMTATADIKVAEKTNVLMAPAAALRFSPPAGARGGGGRRGGSFSLIPQPPRRERKADRFEATQHVYIVKDGQPHRVPVEVGLTNGRFTEVSSPELSEGTEVILEILGTDR
jgi:HlyD family secretion protein